MKKWFTLIEMLIVIVIVGILAWALIPRIWNARDKASDVSRQANVRHLADAIIEYSLDHEGYPSVALATNGGVAYNLDWNINRWNNEWNQENKWDGDDKLDENNGWEGGENSKGWHEWDPTNRVIYSLTLDLSTYWIPEGNFSGNPTEDDNYYYLTSTDGLHFVVFTKLWTKWSQAWNCEFKSMAYYTYHHEDAVYDKLIDQTTGVGWDAFCFLQ